MSINLLFHAPASLFLPPASMSLIHLSHPPAVHKGQTSWLEHCWGCCRHCSPPAQTSQLSPGVLGRWVKINTQQPCGSNCYSHCTLCKPQGLGQEMARLGITSAPLGTAWPLPGHCCSLWGQGWAQTASVPPQCMCPRSNIHTRVTKGWLNLHLHMPLIFHKLWVLRGEVREGEGRVRERIIQAVLKQCPCHPPVQPRGARAVCCYLQCHLWAGEGKMRLNGQTWSPLMNHSDPDFWGQKTHHRLKKKPVFVILPELQVRWALESNMWDGTWVPQAALFKVLPQQSSVLSTANCTARFTELKVSCGILHFTPTPSQPAKSAHSWWPRISFIPAQQPLWFTQWKM